MSWFSNILHGFARAFTIPRAERAVLDANPLAGVVKDALAMELSAVITTTVGSHVSDPATAGAVTAALLHAVDMTGITKT